MPLKRTRPKCTNPHGFRSVSGDDTCLAFKADPAKINRYATLLVTKNVFLNCFFFRDCEDSEPMLENIRDQNNPESKDTQQSETEPTMD